MTINEEKLRETIHFTPHEKQLEVIESASRDLAICAGRRGGKSAVAAYFSLRELLKDNKRIWVVAPTYELSGKVFNYVAKWFGMVAPSQKGWISRRVPMKIETPWGSELNCKSTDSPESLLGEEVDLLIVDEAAKISRNVYEQYLFPVTASRQGRSIFISTPWGKNWFYEKWIQLKEEGGAFQFTSKDNPYFPIEEWDRARELLPEMAFKQNYMATFIEGAGSVFRNVRANIKDCVSAPIIGRSYIIGVDLGRYKDFTVIAVMDTYSHEIVYIDRFKETSWAIQRSRIVAASIKYLNARVIVDSTGLGDPIVEELQADGIMAEGLKFSVQSKKQLIEKLSSFVEQGNVYYPNEPFLIDELDAFSYDITDAGNIKYSAPAGFHDDGVIALALAVWGIQSNKPFNRANLKKKTKTKIVHQYI